MWPARHWCQSAGPQARNQQEPIDQAFTDAKQPLSSCYRRHWISIPHHLFKDALSSASGPSGCPCSAFCPRSSSSSLSGPPRWLKLHPGLNHHLRPPAAQSCVLKPQPTRTTAASLARASACLLGFPLLRLPLHRTHSPSLCPQDLESLAAFPTCSLL